ncbi:hypothetical protein GO003_004265 [Methylicorpusculum oleiharenae]|uniref:hypothetical protein n=1 Tax=Methylicorpusculum oleiharenae TaxID=1338687 RepID=UPI001E37A30F|nr:hypothetical protein [Methylicorpusculum oleiharenae]MCD2449600.1 hypothetical protein [Methylicorpusculum oleiharenae]
MKTGKTLLNGCISMVKGQTLISVKSPNYFFGGITIAFAKKLDTIDNSFFIRKEGIKLESTIDCSRQSWHFDGYFFYYRDDQAAMAHVFFGETDAVPGFFYYIDYGYGSGYAVRRRNAAHKNRAGCKVTCAGIFNRRSSYTDRSTIGKRESSRITAITCKVSV